MHKIYLALVALAIVYDAEAATSAEHHQNPGHHDIEEVFVSAPFQDSDAETTLPVNSLWGEALQREMANSLGDTLKNQVGIHGASFGPGVGHVIIRGQSGKRVQVMQNSVNNVDASSVSPDHANGLEPILAKRIEVVRGPATLLYGNGAIGGIVNVIDERIPESSFSRPEFALEHSHDTNNDENKSVARLNLSLGRLNIYLDGYTRDNSEVEINGYAIDVRALEAEEEHEGEEEEIINSHGFIANSKAQASGHTLGFSLSSDRGFLGLAVNELNSEYGLPPGSHGHGEHDPSEDDHAEADDHEEEGQALVRVDMQQTRYDLAGELEFHDSLMDSLRFNINYTDYEHTEIELSPDGDATPGTHFSNAGIESRLTLKHHPLGGWQGVLGMQVANTTFSATGEEAFIPKIHKDTLAVFAIERFEAGKGTWELGFRWEHNRLAMRGRCDIAEDSYSLSGSYLRNLSSESNLLLAISHSERTPTIEELYSNIDTASCARPLDDARLTLHAATALFELGNPGLGKETSNNIDIGYRRHAGKWTLEANAYYNSIKDYVYLLETGEAFEGQEIAAYFSQNADFYGLEVSLGLPLFSNATGRMDINFTGDYVRARFDRGGNVPRIPPGRVGLKLGWYANNWSADLRLKQVLGQNDAAVGESETDGHTLFELYADYHWEIGNGEVLLFAKSANILDEEIRNHTSFLKHYAPEPGRGIRMGLRYIY